MSFYTLKHALQPEMIDNTVKMAQALATRLVIDENGYLRVVNLPETDPQVDGALYLDGGDLKVSRPL